MADRLKELEDGIENADLSALLYDSLPKVPEYISEALNRIGGFVPNSDKPLFRIVSGLDPKIQEFAFGEWHRKYVSVRDTVKEITGVQTTHYRTQKKQFFPVKEAISKQIMTSDGNLTKYALKDYFCLITTSESLVEYGVPRYVLEKFKSAEEFGTPEEWEAGRYLEIDDPINTTGRRIDALGEYPKEGRYDKFCYIEDGLQDLDGEIRTTTYKPLTEEVINQIADLIEMSKNPAIETFNKIIEKADEKQEKREKDFDFNLEKGIKENQGRITNMPQIGYGGKSRTQG